MLGDVIYAYSQALLAAGYTENKDIDTDDFQPASSADKSYYVQGVAKASESYTGNYETASLGMGITVLIRYHRKNTYAANEQAAWNEISNIERDIKALAATRGDALNVDGIESERVEDFKVFRLSVTCSFERNMAVMN
ncbi:MAG TPA: hypothetical protein VLH56_11330 [Dissulfurispiraceae bacterium]|nr:hypothetical protein [Dissulfurispiraceae bacterium]